MKENHLRNWDGKITKPTEKVLINLTITICNYYNPIVCRRTSTRPELWHHPVWRHAILNAQPIRSARPKQICLWTDVVRFWAADLDFRPAVDRFWDGCATKSDGFVAVRETDQFRNTSQQHHDHRFRRLRRHCAERQSVWWYAAKQTVWHRLRLRHDHLAALHRFRNRY